MLSCNPPVDDFDFADVLTALTEPALINPDARQLTTDYAKLLPGIVNLPPGERGYPLSAALILCEPLASRNTVAASWKYPRAPSLATYTGAASPPPTLPNAPRRYSMSTCMSCWCGWSGQGRYCSPTPGRPGIPIPCRNHGLPTCRGERAAALARCPTELPNLSVYQGMLDAGSAYRKRTSECHGHLVREVQAAKVAIQRQGKPGK